MYRSHNRLGGQAPTLGVLLDWIGDRYQIEVLRGLEEGAESAGANLLCFVGGPLPCQVNTEARHRVYELASAHCLDGLVLLASTLVHKVGAAGLLRYCERYRPLPTCSIGVELEGIASLSVDSEQGISEAISHLVRDHALSRIGFVRGPAANGEAEQRFAAYRAALEQHGIAFDERLVVCGNFSSASGWSAASELTKTFGKRLDGVDGIMCANDGMALGLLRALAEREIDVPGRIAVIGFDDIEDARLNQPSLTTVRQPLAKLGQQAIRMLLESVQHRARPESVRFGAELVKRRSCGCSSLPLARHAQPAVAGGNYGFEASLVVRRQHILDNVARAAHGALGAAGQDWAGRLLSALVSDLGEPDGMRFVAELQNVMDKLLARGVDLNVCDDVIGALRQQLLPSMKSDAERRDRAEELFHLARLATSGAIQRALARDRLQTAHGARTISWACNAFTATFDYLELRASILEQLSRLGIESCFIVLYPENGPEKSAFMFLGYDEGTEKYWPKDAYFEQKTLLPNEWVRVADQKGRSFVVMPLVWKQQTLGHVLVEFHLIHAFAYGAIAEAISSALHGAALAAQAQAGAAL